LRPATPRRGGVDGPRGVPFRRVADRAATVLTERRSFDLAFVDGDHRFDGVFVDLCYLGRLLRSGGIVFLDDYQLPAVARATSFRVTNLAWTLEEVSGADDAHQWAVLRTPEEPDTRPFDYYIDF
jgi:predicted O-methyltransferase YrrM